MNRGQSRTEVVMLKFLKKVPVSKKAVIPTFRVPVDLCRNAAQTPLLSFFIATFKHCATMTAFSSYHMLLNRATRF